MPFFCLAMAANVARSNSDSRSFRRYAGMLFLFGLISQPFYMLFGHGINIMFFLLAALGILLPVSRGGGHGFAAAVFGVVLALNLPPVFSYESAGLLIPTTFYLALRSRGVAAVAWVCATSVLCAIANGAMLGMEPQSIPVDKRVEFWATMVVASIAPAVGVAVLNARVSWRIPPVGRWGYAFYPVQYLVLWFSAKLFS
jgi:hypothetical protein